MSQRYQQNKDHDGRNCNLNQNGVSMWEQKSQRT